MANHVVWLNKHARMPEWLRPPEERDDIPYNAATDPRKLWISYRYWIKIWHATPMWATREPIAAIYKEAEQRRAAGEDVVVDHVVPLAHPLVCGLHWHINLQIISYKANAHKSNNWWPDMPFEQTELEL